MKTIGCRERGAEEAKEGGGCPAGTDSTTQAEREQRGSRMGSYGKIPRTQPPTPVVTYADYLVKAGGKQVERGEDPAIGAEIVVRHHLKGARNRRGGVLGVEMELA